VDRELEAVRVAGETEVDVVGGREVQPAALLEAESRVEAARGVDVADADAGVDEGGRHAGSVPPSPPAPEALDDHRAVADVQADGAVAVGAEEVRDVVEGLQRLRGGVAVAVAGADLDGR